MNISALVPGNQSISPNRRDDGSQPPQNSMGLPQGMKGTADSSDDDGGGSDDNDDNDVDDGDRFKEKGLSPGPKSSHFGDHLQYMKLNDSRKEYTPPCLTIGRHPVDRAISYYYERSFKGFDERIFNHLSVSEVIFFAFEVVTGDPIFKVFLDDGPSNMMARAYSGIRNLTGMTYDWMNDSQMKVPAHSIISAEECGLAYERLDHCVIGILEDMENTRQVLKHWFPWMQTFKSMHKYFKRDSFMNVVDTDKNKIDVKETRHTIRPELREVLETANYCDMILYDRMKETFEKQLQVLNASRFTA
jgi:hypothetical protein